RKPSRGCRQTIGCSWRRTIWRACATRISRTRCSSRSARSRRSCIARSSSCGGCSRRSSNRPGGGRVQGSGFGVQGARSGSGSRSMFCDEALDAIEPIAAGEVTPDGRVAEHLATCPNCAAALEGARQLERALRARAVPPAPAQFTSRTLARLRRAKYRSDQFLDVGFNVAVVALVLALFVGLWMLLNRSGLNAVSNDVVDLFGSGLVAFVHPLAPSLPVYAGAAALLASALGLWWWAERDAAL